MRASLSLSAVLMLAACGGKATTESVEAVSGTSAAEAQALAELGKSIAAAMNPEADPCVDFYEYACGGWLESTELPADKTRMTRSFTTIYDQNQILLREILDGADPSDTSDPAMAKVGAFYQSCMDEETIEAKGLEPIQPLLARLDAAKDNKALFLIAGDMQLHNSAVLYSVGVEPDYKNPTTNNLGLSQGGLGMPDRSYYLEEASADTKAAYQAHIEKMLVLSGVAAGTAAKNAKAVVAFETKLAELSWPREELRDAEKTYHPMDKKGLKALAPGLDFAGVFTQIGYGGLDAFNVGTPSFFTGLDALLKSTPPATVRAYLRFHAISDGAPYLTKALDQEHFAFYSATLRGQKEEQPRWKRCVARTEAALGEELGKVYVAKAFAGDSKEIAVDMIQRIEDEFEKGMTHLDWMDEATRKVAIEKSQAITNKIGYPDKWRDYGTLKVRADDHYGNVMRGNKHDSIFWLDMAGEEVDKDLWYMTPQMVNAYYNPLANEIAFPAGIMQPPFFSRNFPKALNYGAMGMVMGHEVSHGFDDSGRKFSATGAMTEWWAPEVAERFEERATCIEEQYAGYEVQSDLFVNGKLTLGENIADLGGLKQAHAAYMKWREENGPEPEVAGLSNEQLFFIANAQGWCTISTPEQEKVQVKSDPHSPARFRVNGPVKNFPAFGKAFQCEQGAPLYPAADDICVIW
jgi:endothelin-converting enzyme/putative endopeptidase